MLWPRGHAARGVPGSVVYSLVMCMCNPYTAVCQSHWYSWNDSMLWAKLISWFCLCYGSQTRSCLFAKNGLEVMMCAKLFKFKVCDCVCAYVYVCVYLSVPTSVQHVHLCKYANTILCHSHPNSSSSISETHGCSLLKQSPTDTVQLKRLTLNTALARSWNVGTK